MAKSERHTTRLADLIQQGDVLLERARLPRTAVAVARRILAEGEATGHAHRLAEASDGLLYETPDGRLWLRVGRGGATVTHEEHHAVVMPPGDYQIRRVREYDHWAEEARAVRD